MRRPRGPTQSEEIHENGNEKDPTEISQEGQQDYDLDGSQAPRRSRSLIFNPARRNGRDGLNLRGRRRDGDGPFFLLILPAWISANLHDAVRTPRDSGIPETRAIDFASAATNGEKEKFDNCPAGKLRIAWAH
jgi:hypothetical protein